MRRRAFLRSGLAVSLVAVAGCSDGDSETPTDGTPTSTPEETPTEKETPTEEQTPTEEDETPTDEELNLEDEEENPDSPANFRWDMNPGRNNNIRGQLSVFVDNVGSVRQDHPAFDFSTERENDDRSIDFEAYRMIRDSNFEVMKNYAPNVDSPLETIVESFVDDSLYSNVKNDIYRSHIESPETFTADVWLNADTVEESLDLGHNYLITLRGEEQMSTQEMAVSIREAYQRHHDFDVLAWEVPLNDGTLKQGMIYSPDDDKIRSFAGFGDWYGGGEAQFHTEIQDWDVINDPSTDAYDLQHPILFHTDEWDRQGTSFEDAKESAKAMVFSIATEDYTSYNIDASEMNDAIVDNIAITKGGLEQITRTMLEYNDSSVDADFGDIWDLAGTAVAKYLENPELNGVIDTVEPGDNSYDEYFGGGFAFYEVENEEIVDEVRNDQNHEYDHFGEVYDELDTAA